MLAVWLQDQTDAVLLQYYVNLIKHLAHEISIDKHQVFNDINQVNLWALIKLLLHHTLKFLFKGINLNLLRTSAYNHVILFVLEFLYFFLVNLSSIFLEILGVLVELLIDVVWLTCSWRQLAVFSFTWYITVSGYNAVNWTATGPIIFFNLLLCFKRWILLLLFLNDRLLSLLDRVEVAV